MHLQWDHWPIQSNSVPWPYADPDPECRNSGSNDEIQWGVGNVMKGAGELGSQIQQDSWFWQPWVSPRDISHLIVSVSAVFAVKKMMLVSEFLIGRKIKISRISRAMSSSGVGLLFRCGHSFIFKLKGQAQGSEQSKYPQWESNPFTVCNYSFSILPATRALAIANDRRGIQLFCSCKLI